MCRKVPRALLPDAPLVHNIYNFLPIPIILRARGSCCNSRIFFRIYCIVPCSTRIIEAVEGIGEGADPRRRERERERSRDPRRAEKSGARDDAHFCRVRLLAVVPRPIFGLPVAVENVARGEMRETHSTTDHIIHNYFAGFFPSQ